EADCSALLGRLAARFGKHRRREVDTRDAVPTRRELQAQKPGTAACIQHVERTAPGQHEIENPVPGSALRRGADTVPEILVKMCRPPAPMGGNLLLYRVGLSCCQNLSPRQGSPTTEASASSCSP